MSNIQIDMRGAQTMGLLKRALISVKRNLLKSVVLVVLIVILGSVISGVISVNNAVANVEMNLRRQMPTVVRLQYNDPFGTITTVADWMFDERREFNENVIRAIGELPYVELYNYSNSDILWSLYLRQYRDEQFWINNPWSEPVLPGEGFDVGFGFQGFSRPEIVYIEAGALEFVVGRTFTAEEIAYSDDNSDRVPTAIISRFLAQYNDVWVGDMIEFSSIIFDSIGPDGERLGYGEFITVEYEFEIIGIWDYSDDSYLESEARENYEHFMNQIFVPNWIIDDIEQEWFYYNGCFEGMGFRCRAVGVPFIAIPRPIFILSDPLYLDDFRTAAFEILPAGGWFFEDYSNRFATINHSTDILLNITGMMMWGAIGAAVLVITLTISLFLHDRRHEIGVYLAMGEKRAKILWQILTEVLAVSLIGITIALFVGNVVSNQISQIMLLNEMTAFDDDQPWHANWPSTMEIYFGQRELSHQDMLDAFDTSLSAEIVTLFYAVGLGTVAVSTLIPIIYVVKLEPKKVLL